MSEIERRETRKLSTIRTTMEDQKSRRECFDNMAIAQSFDPLVPGNWYKLSYAVLDKHKVSFSPLVHSPFPSSLSFHSLLLLSFY